MSRVRSRLRVRNFLAKRHNEPTYASRVRSVLEMTPLTERQKECLVLIAKDLTRKQMALKLRLSVKTIDYHVRVLRKLTGGQGDVSLAIWAIQQGFVRIPGVYIK